MPLTSMVVAALAATCAPDISPATLTAVARVESGLDPLAIGVNGAAPRTLHPKSLQVAMELARRLMQSGANVDLGLGQINARNLPRLHLKLEDAFQPCANLEAAASLLREGYATARAEAEDEPLAVLRTLSIYNTGRAERGLDNGYVAKVLAAAAPPQAAPHDPFTDNAGVRAPAWAVFGSNAGAASLLIFSASKNGADR